MRPVPIAFALAIVATAAATAAERSRYRVVGTTAEVVVFVDVGRMQKRTFYVGAPDGPAMSEARTWVLWVYRTPRTVLTIENGLAVPKRAEYQLAQETFNCTDHSTTSDVAVDYDTSGRVLRSTRDYGTNPIVPNSLMELIEDVLCGQPSLDTGSPNAARMFDSVSEALAFSRLSAAPR